MKQIDLTGKTILIVEDSKDSAFLLNEFLSTTHANLIFIDNGDKAIECCLDNKEIDLILMDIKIKGINGIQAMKKIKGFRKIPIIAQSSFVYESDIERFINDGFDGFLKKPIIPDELFKTIGQFLNN